MDWFNIIGTILGFIGSVIFSAALLKGNQQIKDENGTYWTGNPYTSTNDIESQKYYRVAFALLIAGFAVVIGGELRKHFEHSPVLIGTLIAITLTSVGFLIAVLLFIHRANQHLKLREKIKKASFRSTIKSLKLDMAKNVDKTGVAYRKLAELRFKNLRDTLSQIPTEHATQETDLLREMDAATTVQEMIEQATTFLSN